MPTLKLWPMPSRGPTHPSMVGRRVSWPSSTRYYDDVMSRRCRLPTAGQCSSETSHRRASPCRAAKRPIYPSHIRACIAHVLALTSGTVSKGMGYAAEVRPTTGSRRSATAKQLLHDEPRLLHDEPEAFITGNLSCCNETPW